MARSGAKSSYRARKTLPALERYERLCSFDQLVCYNYWIYLLTGGAEGWDLKKAGFKQHWSHFAPIKARYRHTQFYTLGKSMAALAKEISANGHHLEQPDITPPEDNYTQIEEEEGDAFFEEEYGEEEEYDDTEEYIMPTKTIQKKFVVSTKMRTPEKSEAVSNDDDPTLPYPMVWGSYKTFNLTSRKRFTHILFRVLVHSFMTINDIEFSWVNPWKLKIRVAWPDWWVMPEQQAEFDVDESTGIPAFDINHPLIGEMMEINEAKKEDDGRVWDVGYFSFDQDMSTEPIDTIIRLRPLRVESAGQVGQFISVKTTVYQGEAPKKANLPLRPLWSHGPAKPGTGGAGATSNRTRKTNNNYNPVGMDVDGRDDGQSNDRRVRGRTISNSNSRARTRSHSRDSVARPRVSTVSEE